MADDYSKIVYFFREYEEPYGFLSQWYERTFVVDGTPYKCAEMWMMAQKSACFGDEPSRRAILRAPTPRKQKSLGRKVANFDFEVWEQRKYDVVVQGNMHKFGQAPDLRRQLLETGERELVEASRFDSVWGIGFDAATATGNREWWGENLLGKALMEVRMRFREEKEAATAAAAAGGKGGGVEQMIAGLQRHPPSNPTAVASSAEPKKRKGKWKRREMEWEGKDA
ncbi:hypothetical protein BKA81DRAFT_223971 [Phyllosticta paracitricarpa]|uniref:NADAR domain-containing protein n=1 Tax=Phyllosticta paracitricarpa TaxID=2016321 RepID=A0ABR1NAL8_9PEZI